MNSIQSTSEIEEASIAFCLISHLILRDLVDLVLAYRKIKLRIVKQEKTQGVTATAALWAQPTCCHFRTLAFQSLDEVVDSKWKCAANTQSVCKTSPSEHAWHDKWDYIYNVPDGFLKLKKRRYRFQDLVQNTETEFHLIVVEKKEPTHHHQVWFLHEKRECENQNFKIIENKHIYEGFLPSGQCSFSYPYVFLIKTTFPFWTEQLTMINVKTNQIFDLPYVLTTCLSWTIFKECLLIVEGTHLCVYSYFWSEKKETVPEFDCISEWQFVDDFGTPQIPTYPSFTSHEDILYLHYNLNKLVTFSFC